MSKIYLDRKDPSGPYIFISYSSKNQDCIERVLTALNDRGGDFWYDKDLHGGDLWFERVKQVTADKRCMGMIYFVSAPFVYSNACLKELELLEELEKTHKNFGSLFVLLDEEETPGFARFKSKVMSRLLGEHPDDFEKVHKAVGDTFSRISPDKKWYATTYDGIDDEEFVKKMFDEIFKAWGCAYEEVGSLDALLSAELVDRSYRIKTGCRVHTDAVHRRDSELKAFAYSGNTISAALVTDGLFAETCLSLAQSAMDVFDSHVVTDTADIKDGGDDRKYIVFDDPKFLNCVIRDEKGRALRYLKSIEREKYFLQLREVLERVPIADAADDGYFFVRGDDGDIMFSDRYSDDVYRHVHVDAYASVLPVIDIDYNKYREYILAKSKA